jgi:alpha-glucosidase (family GH31 glycosyl hydrolase)
LNQPFWPINNQSFDYVPYVTGFADEWGAVLERYWLSSNGLALLVEDDVALFVNHNNPTRICLKASNKTLPYKNLHAYRENKFAYKVCTAENMKQVHMFMVENYLGMASSRPDSLMVKSPIFTTWNYFFKNINQSVVIDYANQIHSNNYSISQLEIDDKWERFYGDLDFDRTKFPNPSEMVATLENMNMRVTLWVHPFCNIDSMYFINGTNEELWVKDVSGQHPAFTSWWNGKYATILDTTNPKTLDYFTNKLDFLKNTYGIRSFKFDAGESHWLPDEFSLHGKNSTLDEYAQNYVKLAANQNSFVEVRTAHRIQNVGLFYRILDRSSSWSINNGLKSVLTETLYLQT